MALPIRSESLRSPAEAFRDAVSLIGSQSATSRLIGLSQQAISDRLAKGQSCPAERGIVLAVEAATGISRHDLRPDIYPRDHAMADRDPAAMEPAR